MPDATRHSGDATPATWSQAFAALPDEVPPREAWSRVAASLTDAPSRRASRPAWPWAIAATLAVAASGTWLALSAYREAPSSVDERAIATVDAPRVRSMPQPAAETAPTSISINKVASVPATATVASARHDARPTVARAARRTTHNVPRTTLATADAPARADTPTTDPLDTLRAESARLESLVALARDDSMQSAPAALLTADVDDRLRLIDAALSQPGLDDAERVQLWTRRVDALHELAGIEGTQRWMASRGVAMDAVARVD